MKSSKTELVFDSLWVIIAVCVMLQLFALQVTLSGIATSVKPDVTKPNVAEALKESTYNKSASDSDGINYQSQASTNAAVLKTERSDTSACLMFNGQEDGNCLLRRELRRTEEKVKLLQAVQPDAAAVVSSCVKGQPIFANAQEKISYMETCLAAAARK